MELVTRLLAAGADPLTVDSNTGATALHKACQGGNVECARLLLDAGANVKAVNKWNEPVNAMFVASDHADPMWKLLTDRGAAPPE